MRRRSWSWPVVARRAVAGLALVAYCATAAGMPVPGPRVGRGSASSPCQGGRCGCQTEADCRDHCCCGGPVEREAPPPTEPGSAGCPHCAATGTDAGLGSSPSTCCAKDNADAEPARTTAVVRWVLAWQVRKCRGTAADWVGLGCVVPPPPLVRWSPQWPEAERLPAATPSPTTSPSHRPTPRPDYSRPDPGRTPLEDVRPPCAPASQRPSVSSPGPPATAGGRAPSIILPSSTHEPSSRVYPHRAAGRDCHHRRPHRALAACGPEGTGSRQPHEMHE